MMARLADLAIARHEAAELADMLRRICLAETRMPGNNPIAGLCDEARELLSKMTVTSHE